MIGQVLTYAVKIINDNKGTAFRFGFQGVLHISVQSRAMWLEYRLKKLKAQYAKTQKEQTIKQAKLYLAKLYSLIDSQDIPDSDKALLKETIAKNNEWMLN